MVGAGGRVRAEKEAIQGDIWGTILLSSFPPVLNSVSHSCSSN